mgnify:CR=1 FL=1
MRLRIQLTKQVTFENLENLYDLRKISVCIPVSKLEQVDSNKYLLSGVYSYGLASFPYKSEIILSKLASDNLTLDIHVYINATLVSVIKADVKHGENYVEVEITHKAFTILGKIIEKLIRNKIEALIKCIISQLST